MSSVRPHATSASLFRAALEDLRGRPLACAVALFAVGIGCGAKHHVPAVWALASVGAGVGLLATLMARHSRLSAGALLLLAAFAGGFAYSVTQVRRPGDVATFDREAHTFEGSVSTDPHRWGDRQAMVVDLDACVNPTTGARSAAGGGLWLTCVTPARFDRGDRIRFTGVVTRPHEPTNPAEATRAPALEAAGISALAYVGDERLIERLGVARLGAIERARSAFRDYVGRTMRDSMPGPYRDILGALLGSIVFGSRAYPLPPDVVAAFRGAGVMHVLVVSGTQISLLFAIVYTPGALAIYYRRRRLGKVAAGPGALMPPPSHVSLALVLLLIAAYALMAEGGRTVGRAAVMGGVVACGLLLRRAPRFADHHPLELDHYTIMAAALLALLLAHPEGVFDIGLQMSLGAVLGLVYLGAKIAQPLRRLPRWLALTVSSTIAAQLALLPITAWHFHTISPMGFIANLFVIPLAGVLLATGIAVALLGSFSPPLATLVNGLNAPLLLALVRATHAMAQLPGATMRVDITSPWQLVAYYAGLLALAAAADRWWRRRHPGDHAAAV